MSISIRKECKLNILNEIYQLDRKLNCSLYQQIFERSNWAVSTASYIFQYSDQLQVSMPTDQLFAKSCCYHSQATSSSPAQQNHQSRSEVWLRLGLRTAADNSQHCSLFVTLTLAQLLQSLAYCNGMHNGPGWSENS